MFRRSLICTVSKQFTHCRSITLHSHLHTLSIHTRGCHVILSPITDTRGRVTSTGQPSESQVPVTLMHTQPTLPYWGVPRVSHSGCRRPATRRFWWRYKPQLYACDEQLGQESDPPPPPPAAVARGEPARRGHPRRLGAPRCAPGSGTAGPRAARARRGGCPSPAWSGALPPRRPLLAPAALAPRSRPAPAHLPRPGTCWGSAPPPFRQPARSRLPPPSPARSSCGTALPRGRAPHRRSCPAARCLSRPGLSARPAAAGPRLPCPAQPGAAGLAARRTLQVLSRSSDSPIPIVEGDFPASSNSPASPEVLTGADLSRNSRQQLFLELAWPPHLQIQCQSCPLLW